MDNLKERIHQITKYQKPYIANSLMRMTEKGACNVKVICDYIIAEQNEINIKESTKEGKIKCLVRFSSYLQHKPFQSVSKEDVLAYLTALKKPESLDPQHKSIGTYNGRQMILLKFFRWLNNRNESDARKRLSPDCMNGIKRLPRMEKSPYKPSDLWTQEEHEVFLKYCPSIRDRLYHAMAYAYSRQNKLGRITRDGLLKKYEQYYKKRFFPLLLVSDTVSERDKTCIRNLLMKPFSLYIFRHTALTHKSAFLKEHILRDHAGWSMTSKMPQVYLHYFGTESANSILEAYGIIKNESPGANLLKPIQCPNCHESNNKETRICVSCKMILKYDAYAEALDDKESKEVRVSNQFGEFKDGHYRFIDFVE